MAIALLVSASPAAFALDPPPEPDTSGWLPVPEGEDDGILSTVTGPAPPLSVPDPLRGGVVHNLTDATNGQLETVLGLTRSLTPRELPEPNLLPINVSELDLNVTLPSLTEALPVLSNVTNATVPTLDPNVTTIVDELLDIPLGGGPSLPPVVTEALPDWLPELTYRVCWTTQFGKECHTAIAFGVPFGGDFNNDGIFDILVTVLPCGLMCLQGNIDRNVVPGALQTPAMVYVIFDTDGSTADTNEEIVAFGYDTYSHGKNNPGTFQVTASTFTTGTTSSSFRGGLAVSGAQVPLTFFAQYQKKASNVIQELQDFRITWSDVVPSPIDVTASFDNGGKKSTSITYTGGTAAKTSALYTRQVASGNKLDQTFVDANKLPASWSVTSNWFSNGNEDHTYSAGATISRLEFIRLSLANNQPEAVMKGVFTNVPSSLTVKKGPCMTEVVAGSAMGITFQSGTNGFLSISAPNHLALVKTSSQNYVSLSIPSFKSFKMYGDCHNGQGFSSIQYDLGAPLNTFYLVFYNGQTYVEVDIAQANGRGLPATATFELRGRKFVLTGTSSAFGVIRACYTTTLTCVDPGSGGDFVLVYEDPSHKSVTGRITGLKTAVVGEASGTYEATATFEANSNTFDAFYLVGQNQFYGHVSNIPSMVSLTTDAKTNGVFKTSSSISQIFVAARSGSQVAYLQVDNVAADTQATFTATFPAKYSFVAHSISSTSTLREIGAVTGCFAKNGACAVGGGNYAVIIDNQFVSARVERLKQFTVDFGSSRFAASYKVGAPFDFAAAYRSSNVNYDAFVCRAPAEASASFDGASNVKSFSFSGSSRTDCFEAIAYTSTRLLYYAHIAGIPSSVSATWNLESSGTGARTLSLTTGGQVDSIFATALLTGTAWRSVSVCIEGLNGFDASWSSDLSELSATVKNGLSVGRLRAILYEGVNTGCAGIEGYDYAVYSANGLRLAAAQVTGFKGLSVKMTPGETRASYQSTGGKVFSGLWVNGANSAAFTILNTAASMTLTTNNVDYAKWEATSEVTEVTALGAINGAQFYVGLSGVPKLVETKYDGANRNAKFTVDGKLTSATLWIVKASGSPRLVYAHATAVSTTTVSWAADLTSGGVTVSSEIGSIEFAIDFTGAGASLPADTGVHRIKYNSVNYVGGRVKGLRGLTWSFANSQLDASFETSRGNGQTVFEVIYFENGNYAEASVGYLPGGKLTLKSDLKTYLDFTTPARIQWVYALGQVAGYQFYAYLQDLTSVNVKYDTSGSPPAKTIGVTTGASISRAEVFVKYTGSGGIGGTGFRNILVVATSIPKTMKFKVDPTSGDYVADFGGDTLGSLFAWASQTECGLFFGHDFFSWYTGCGGDAFSLQLRGMQKVQFKDSGSQKTASVRAKNGGEFIAIKYKALSNPDASYVYVSNLPGSSFTAGTATATVTVANPGGFTWTADQRVNFVEVFTNEIQSNTRDYALLQVSPIPRSMSGTWNFGGEGSFSFKANERMCLYLQGNLYLNNKDNSAQASLCLQAVRAAWKFGSAGHVELDTRYCDGSSCGSPTTVVGYIYYVIAPPGGSIENGIYLDGGFSANQWKVSWSLWPPRFSKTGTLSISSGTVLYVAHNGSWYQVF